MALGGRHRAHSEPKRREEKEEMERERREER
jgi:hypothetical protein